ncbi:MAG: AAA family ATPase [Bacteroidota bacterium]
MDYIKKLKAKHIGIFEDLEISFSKNTNIIIGGNSSGKTTILKLITYCFSNSHFSGTRFRSGASFDIDLFSNGQEYKVGLNNVVDEDQVYRQFKATRWNPPIQNPGEEKRTLLPYNPAVHNLFAIGASRYFDYKAISGMQREKKGTDRIDYYKNNNSQFLEKPILPDIKQWMINRYFVIEKEWASIEKNNWQHLIENLNSITPKGMEFSFSRIERDLEPLFRINDNECYLEELSSGIKSILAIVLSITDWIEGVNDGKNALLKNATGTVLIDEIDTHLHPNWQASIVGDLRTFFPKLQFIFTTHSPHIISSAKKNEIIKIPAHNGTLNIKPLQKEFNTWELDYILDDLMDTSPRNSPDLDFIIDKLDQAYENKEIDEYDKQLKKLKRIIHPKDTILQVYIMKKSRLVLKK